MGLMTLEEFSEEIHLNISAKNPDKKRLNRWVNFGYLNLCSHVRFDELRVITSLVTVANTTDYTAPTDMQGIISIRMWDATTDPITKKLSLALMDKEFHVAGADVQPTHYLLRGTQLVLWPNPDAVYTGEIEYVKQPTKLSSPTSVTVIPASWDVAMVMLGTHHAFLSLNKQDEADRWLGRFLGYKASRITEQDYEKSVPKGGINVAWTREEMGENPADIG